MKNQIEMKSSMLNDVPAQTERSRGRLRKKVLNRAVCSISATVGIFGGISSLVAGLICIVIHGLVPGDIVFDRTGTVLLIIAIPMILLGAVFLDEIEPTIK